MVKPNQILEKNVLFALLGKFALENRKIKISEGRKNFCRVMGMRHCLEIISTEGWMQKGELSVDLGKRKLVKEMRTVFTYFKGNFVEELLIF